MFKLFSGTANPKLTEEVSKLLNRPLSQSEVIRFENSEVRVRVTEDVKNSNVVIIQSTANPTDTHLMELFFFCDALRRQEAKKVIGILPYFGYARQDIQHREGECVSVNVLIRFFESIGFHKIYTIDLHDEATQGVFSIPFKNISALSLLASKVHEYIGKAHMNPEEVAIVSPDQGGIERARKFEEHLFDGQNPFDIPLVVIEKRRNLEKIHRSKALALYGNVNNKTVILVDDIVTSGGTLVHAAQLCLDNGAKRVLAAIVHHDFSEKAPERIQQSAIEKFFTTNTITLKENQIFSKLEEISVAPLIAAELSPFI